MRDRKEEDDRRINVTERKKIETERKGENERRG